MEDKKMQLLKIKKKLLLYASVIFIGTQVSSCCEQQENFKSKISTSAGKKLEKIMTYSTNFNRK